MPHPSQEAEQTAKGERIVYIACGSRCCQTPFP